MDLDACLIYWRFIWPYTLQKQFYWLQNTNMCQTSSIEMFPQCFLFMLAIYMFSRLFSCYKRRTTINWCAFWWKQFKNFPWHWNYRYHVTYTLLCNHDWIYFSKYITYVQWISGAVISNEQLNLKKLKKSESKTNLFENILNDLKQILKIKKLHLW